MNTISFIFIVGVTLWLFSSPQPTFAVDLISAQETCFTVDTSITAKVDSTWASSVKKWYYSKMSRYDLYVVAGLILSKPEVEIQEDYLYYDGCVTFDNDATTNTSTFTGFGDHKFTFTIAYTEGFEAVNYYNTPPSTLLAVCHTVLTDNKTYFMQVCCYKNGLNKMTWWIGSTTPTVPAETLKKIHDRAEQLGFNKKQFTGLEYKSCYNYNYYNYNY